MCERRHVDDPAGGALPEQINEGQGEQEGPHVVGCHDNVESFRCQVRRHTFDTYTLHNNSIMNYNETMMFFPSNRLYIIGMFDIANKQSHRQANTQSKTMLSFLPQSGPMQ